MEPPYSDIDATAITLAEKVIITPLFQVLVVKGYRCGITKFIYKIEVFENITSFGSALCKKGCYTLLYNNN